VTTSLASFLDGRKGRTQYRIVGELPNEVGTEVRFAILKEFSKIFEHKKMPFVAVMHAPDHRNDEKNWHFHLIYYDRPCRRITQADIDQLAADGFRSDHLKPGSWDFAAVTPKRHRTNGRATALRQNKVSQVTGKGWIKVLRCELAEITNRHMTTAGVERRLDPRCYEEMGIIADPQEHLGTKQAAAEARGEVTAVGVENEQRQWAAIMAQADDRLSQELAVIDKRVDDWGKEDAAQSSLDDAERRRRDGERLRENLREAAMLDDLAFRLAQNLLRAGSRAAHVRRANDQLLQAYDADPSAGRPTEQEEAEFLVDAASAYLDRLHSASSVELALLAEIRAERKVCCERAEAIEAAKQIGISPTLSRTIGEVAGRAANPIPAQPPSVSKEVEVAVQPAVRSPRLTPVDQYPERVSAVVRNQTQIDPAITAARAKGEPAAAVDAGETEHSGRGKDGFKDGNDGPSLAETKSNDAAKKAAALAAAGRAWGR